MKIKSFYLNEAMNEGVLLGEDGKLYHVSLDEYFERFGENESLVLSIAFEIPIKFINKED